VDLVPADLPVLTTLRPRADAQAWLRRLPGLIAEVRDEFGLRLSAPLHGGSCSWVAPATTPDGTAVIVKIGWPHREMLGEPAALRRWNGRGAVRLIAHDPDRHALLLARCVPAVELGRSPRPAAERLQIGCAVLRRLWSAPATDESEQPTDTATSVTDKSEQPTDVATKQATLATDKFDQLANVATKPATSVTDEFEQLADVAAEWAGLAEERMDRIRPGYDPGLVAEGVRLLRSLPADAERTVLLHGDFNPGNILSDSDGWRAIDPKPLVGDPAYDPWPLLEQIDNPFSYADPGAQLRERVALLAHSLGLPADRIVAWCLARRVETALFAAQHGDVTGGAQLLAEARILADLPGQL